MSQLEATRQGFEFGRDGPNVILVGLDASQMYAEGSEASLRAAAYAAGLARRQDARMVAVWVRPPVAIADTFVETVDEIGRERDAGEAQVRAAVEEAAEHFDLRATSLRVCEGDPFDEVTAVAEEVGVDAIVVGASSQRLGSLTVRLIRDGRWPITVVP